MLFHYKYLTHAMEKMQDCVEFIFVNVWCRAPNAAYGIHLYEPNAVLHQIMNELFKLDSAGKLKDGAARFFYEHVNRIFNEFKSLSTEEIDAYRVRFTANNSIELLCSGSEDVVPVTYDQLSPAYEALNLKMKSFFMQLYSSGFFELKLVRDAIGSTIDRFYEAFVQENDVGVCPFCGLLPIDGKYDPTREAFDHFLPKSKYPFNSVNLKNLAPSCPKCNSGNKLDQDPLRDATGQRRKAFYPFASKPPDITITVQLNRPQWSELSPACLSVEVNTATQGEEVATWLELFRIKQRYESRCCAKNGGLAWLNRVFIEGQNYNLDEQAMLKAEVVTAAAAPWCDANFLKKAFLEGCDEAGVFEIGTEPAGGIATAARAIENPT